VPDPFRILGVSGSLRKASFNRGLIRAAQELVPDGAIIHPLEIDALPHYNRDLEDAGAPSPVAELRDRIAEADAMLIATPEYNTSLPGALKNAIEWASQPYGASVLMHKPVGVMGASPGGGGTQRSQRTLRRVLAAVGCRVLPEPELLVAGAYQHFDAEGNLKDDSVRDEIRALIAALVDFARQPAD
jgi:chromate reductase